MGYIKVYRQMFDNRLWQDKPFARGQAWLDLLLLANHADGGYFTKGHQIDLKRGQLGRSMKELADRWGWSVGKVKRFLDYLKNETQIEYENSTVTTLITIINYDDYQSNGTQTERKRKTDGKQTETYNKNKKNNKEYMPPMGEFENVLLTEDEYAKLADKVDNRTSLIERLSTYMASSGTKYKSHYATILNWHRRDEKEKPKESKYGYIG